MNTSAIPLVRCDDAPPVAPVLAFSGPPRSASMSIVIVTDAWHPQVNGVVRTLEHTANQLRDWGHDVRFITPRHFRSVPLPTYPDIRISLFPKRKVFSMLDALAADAVHIATEGPLGMAARAWCMKHGVRFTTSYHTQFPEYLRLRFPIPLGLSYAWLRRFHAPATQVLAPTLTQKRRLEERGFRNVVLWSRGVDTELFRPCGQTALDHLPRPVHVYVGRVSVEKNLRDFLDLERAGSKVVIGDGPDLETLKDEYPDAHFLGYRFGDELARLLSAADVFVFPSRTDTFGLVMLEALACGVPVAAYPVTGPLDVIREGVSGAMREDLGEAVDAALKLDRARCRGEALKFGWENCTREFLRHLRAAPGKQACVLPLRVSNR